MSPDDYRSIAHACHGNGYRTLVPLLPRDKRPAISSWQHTPIDGISPEKLDRYWRCGTERGIGLVMHGQLIAVDCDILDHELAHDIALACETCLPQTPLTRIGLSPKWMRFFRAPPIPIPTRRLNGIEIFCTGGQVVLFGLHPVTGEPYRWPDGSPASISVDDLPTLPDAAVHRLIDTVGPLLPPLEQRPTAPHRSLQAHRSISHEIRDQVVEALDRSPTIETAIDLVRNALPGARHHTMVCIATGWAVSGLDPQPLVDAFADAAGDDRAGEVADALRWSLQTFGQHDPEFAARLVLE